VTGMNRPIYWGLYISNFVFFIGISHAGTLISAILRLAGAEWRRPITRAAEAITVIALIIAGTQILADMGRPDRLLNLVIHGRFQSPLLWDVTSVGMYFVGSVIYLYLPLIPDLAILRDDLPASTPSWRRRVYRLLALGWHGGPEQRRRLEKAIGVMAVLIIPLAISVHTVVSWIFGMTLQPMWHSSIFGPYFVIGAIYSGIATLLLAMAVIRKAFHLESYLEVIHFRYLGVLLLVFNALWFYFTASEYLTTGYGGVPHEMAVLGVKWSGPYAGAFWTMIAAMTLAFVILILPHLPAPRGFHLPVFRPRYALATGSAAAAVALAMWRTEPGSAQATLVSGVPWTAWLLSVLILHAGLSLTPLFRRGVIAGAVVASLLVDLGMWLERLTIVVPTETQPMLYFGRGVYHPTLVEWTITAAAIAAFGLIYALFLKVFPIISIWEVRESRVGAAAVATGHRGGQELVSPLPTGGH